MRTYVDPLYLDQRQRFRLLATCEHCQHFEPRGPLCSLGFPTEPHREATHAAARDGDSILYCKYFEID